MIDVTEFNGYILQISWGMYVYILIWGFVSRWGAVTIMAKRKNDKKPPNCYLQTEPHKSK